MLQLSKLIVACCCSTGLKLHGSLCLGSFKISSWCLELSGLLMGTVEWPLQSHQLQAKLDLKDGSAFFIHHHLDRDL